MSLQGHIVELQRRHEALKKEIEQEQLHPQANELKIAELKRKKLQIKDELAKLSISETRH
ncbi:MAG: YdcH family protein [Methylocystis sp.]